MKRFWIAAALALISASALAQTSQEVGSYPNATSPLSGTERILADQGSYNTVNITPAQIKSYIFTGFGYLPVTLGGTGLTSIPANGNLLIGNGSSYTLAPLTAGNGISIVNGPGSITITATSSGGNVSTSGTISPYGVPYWASATGIASLLPGATGTYCYNWSSLSAAPTLTSSCGSGGSGTVTSFSFTNGNGFTGTVSNPTTTPALSIAPSFTGLAYSNGSALGAATVGQGLSFSSGTIATTQVINAQTGTTYTVASTDASKLLTFNNAAAVAVTLPQATGSFGAGYSFTVQNLGAGTVTITPTISTINSAATLAISQNMGCSVVSDGTNYQVGACTALVTGGGGSSSWSALTVPSANLSLSMGAFTSTFNQTSAANWTWANTTAATSSTVGDSPILNFNGTYWNGTASATDSWSLQNILATGTNGTSTLTFTHTGSTGTAAIAVPQVNFVSGSNVGHITQSGTNTYVSPTSGGVLRLQNGSADVVTISNNGGAKDGVDFVYPISIQAPKTTITGTSAGTAVWSEPLQSGALQITVIYLNGYENTTATAQTITLPTSYATVSYVVTDGGACTGVTIAGATVTLPASMSMTQTGLCEIRGY